MANERSMGRIDYDLWAFDAVDTVEGDQYRVIDLAGNYHGSYHTEKAAHDAVWDHNRKVASEQGRLYQGRETGVQFILVDDKVRGRVSAGTIVPGKVVINAAGDRVWVDDEWFSLLVVVKV